jgi:hypothetical protein
MAHQQLHCCLHVLLRHGMALYLDVHSQDPPARQDCRDLGCVIGSPISDTIRRPVRLGLQLGSWSGRSTAAIEGL